MQNLFVIAALLGAALIPGIAGAQEAPPAAAPEESAEAPAGESQEIEAPKDDQPAAEADTTEPLPDIKAGGTAEENAADAEPDAGDKANTPADDLRRPTEETDQGGKRVAAFWFISTGN